MGIERHHLFAEVDALTRAYLAQVQRKRRELRRRERMLAATVACCAGGDVPECPVIDALFQR